jgi:hypothetical protein
VRYLGQEPGLVPGRSIHRYACALVTQEWDGRLTATTRVIEISYPISLAAAKYYLDQYARYRSAWNRANHRDGIRYADYEKSHPPPGMPPRLDDSKP